MKIAIAGLSNSGKTTIFNALTGLSLETTVYPTTSGEPHYGVVKVPDERLEKLTDIFKPKKTTNSTVEYIDYLGLTKGDQKQNRSVLEFLKDADAVLHVVRAFKDESVVHPLGDVNPERDVTTLRTELILGDLELVEKRIESMEQGAKRGKKPSETERSAMLKCREALEAEKPLRELEFSAEDHSAMRHLQFMTLKPEIMVLNIAEGDIGSDETSALVKKLSEFGPVAALSGKVEMEIAELPAEERLDFLKDLGIDEPALNKLIRISYDRVGLCSFLTAGEDEVRAWAIKKGTNALNAAGKIHSDIQRGFIRAEVVSYEDFMAAGSFSAARDKGTLRLEGKTYEVKDGDIINFRFNV